MGARFDPTQALVVVAAIVALVGFSLANGLDPALLAASIIVAATPLLLAATGELVAEKSGVLNLGVEGMMITGAICGFAVAVETGSPLLGILAAAIGAAALSLIFGFLTQILLSNQVATGLALTLFGLGLAALIGHPYAGVKPPPFPHLQIPGLSDLPTVGGLLFSHDYMVYAALALTALVWLFLTRTRAGMILRAVGENHDAAHSLGYNVIAIRLAAIAFGGACAGLGGAYLSLIRVPQWTEGMTAGAGWIALAIVVFGAWRPWRVLLGAYLFGGVTILQLNFQAAHITPIWLIALGLMLFALHVTLKGMRDYDSRNTFRMVALWVATLIAAMGASSCPEAQGGLARAVCNPPAQYLSMTPYLVTIIVLTVMSADRLKTNLNAPAALGRVFNRTG